MMDIIKFMSADPSKYQDEESTSLLIDTTPLKSGCGDERMKEFGPQNEKWDADRIMCQADYIAIAIERKRFHEGTSSSDEKYSIQGLAERFAQEAVQGLLEFAQHNVMAKCGYPDQRLQHPHHHRRL
jgi:hypothetical protein